MFKFEQLFLFYTFLENSIGIFDSGLGGTSIFKEVHELLPNENIIYLADSKNAPYGEKSPQEIIDLSLKNTKLLLQKKCKLIIVACNTATTNAIHILRQKHSIPFIGIEPAIKPATLQTKNNKIGILATKGTLSSQLFSKTFKKYVNESIQVTEIEGKKLVEAVESDLLNSTSFKSYFFQHIAAFKKQNIDSLVLGCTHYPYLIPLINEFLPEVQIIDSGFAVAQQTKRVLKQNQLLNQVQSSPKIQFYTNAQVEILSRLLSKHNSDFKQYKVDYLAF
ncbi:MAG: glutamate racemase [Flavobacteriaceae bacterium]|nr:glutamate racemase [Flavobacteriaceae bacterium]